jgi:hypothetical protein
MLQGPRRQWSYYVTEKIRSTKRGTRDRLHKEMNVNKIPSPFTPAGLRYSQWMNRRKSNIMLGPWRFKA